jgi:hypothetical protein
MDLNVDLNSDSRMMCCIISKCWNFVEFLKLLAGNTCEEVISCAMSHGFKNTSAMTMAWKLVHE